MSDINNDYYSIACNDLLYLQYTLDTSFYNNMVVGMQQVSEKMLKSVAERVCVNINKLLNGHNLRGLYDAIHQEIPNFILDRGSLSMLKDFYYDAKYPGENYVNVSREECVECLETMYSVVDAVNSIRKELNLPVFNYKKKYLGEVTQQTMTLF